VNSIGGEPIRFSGTSFGETRPRPAEDLESDPRSPVPRCPQVSSHPAVSADCQGDPHTPARRPRRLAGCFAAPPERVLGALARILVQAAVGFVVFASRKKLRRKHEMYMRSRSKRSSFHPPLQAVGKECGRCPRGRREGSSSHTATGRARASRRAIRWCCRNRREKSVPAVGAELGGRFLRHRPTDVAARHPRCVDLIAVDHPVLDHVVARIVRLESSNPPFHRGSSLPSSFWPPHCGRGRTRSRASLVFRRTVLG